MQPPFFVTRSPAIPGAIRRRSLLAGFLASAAAASGCARLDRSRSVLDAAAAAGLRQFVAITRASGMETLLDGPGPFTVFAPDDAAITALGPERIADLMQPDNRAALRRMIAGHVLPAAYDAEALAARSGAYVTAAGTRVEIAGSAGELTVNGARITDPDIPADNGFLFVIDSVLAAD